MRVFLVGFMGAGKSATGRALARRLASLFVDLDERVEAGLGMPVPEIFRSLGEAAFRSEEARQLAACARFSDLVVATGGGTFAFAENRAVIARLGVSVFLDPTWEDVLRRIPGKREERPLFSSPEAALELYRRRLPSYRAADLRVRPEPGEDAEVVAGRIMLLLGEHG
ncbi:MAG: shikimate kinase [Acidobacteriota bacterium]